MSLKRLVPLSFVIVSVALVGGRVWAQTAAGPGVDVGGVNEVGQAETGAAAVHPNEVYPQIVRLSLVEGDVRVAVGRQKGQAGRSPWVQAATNMPVESGFTVVTGKGRAEIEFEDASTMYLAENSALTFETLTTKDNVPMTNMVLLTGAASLHVRPTVPGERYTLKTQTDLMRVPYGTHADVRVNSYTDAMTVTPLLSTEIHVGSAAPAQGLVGRTFTYSDGVFVATPVSAAAANTYAGWDKWVAARVAARNQALGAVMKESGLNEALPGMADMAARGTFFECKPYGTCWTPTNGWGGAKTGAKAGPKMATDGPPQEASGAQEASGTEAGQEKSPQQLTPEEAKLAAQAEMDEEQAEQGTVGGEGGGVAPVAWVEDVDIFPCSPFQYENWLTQDPYTGDTELLGSDLLLNDDWFMNHGYDWAVCHAGSWIRWHHRYAWVAGRRHHHHPPVRYVKVGGKVGYVPLHPGDVAGKPPVNLRHGILLPREQKGGGGLERVALDSGVRVKVLAETPKEYREVQLPELRAAVAPSLGTRALLTTAGGGGGASVIAFDSKAKGFTITTPAGGGGRAVVSHYSGGARGGEIALRGGGGGAFGGSRATSSGGGGGAARSSGGGASSSGSGGGGGSHSSGGGGAAASAPSGGGGGGSHH